MENQNNRRTNNTKQIPQKQPASSDFTLSNATPAMGDRNRVRTLNKENTFIETNNDHRNTYNITNNTFTITTEVPIVSEIVKAMVLAKDTRSFQQIMLNLYNDFIANQNNQTNSTPTNPERPISDIITESVPNIFSK